MKERRRRLVVVLILALIPFIGAFYESRLVVPEATNVVESPTQTELASDVLNRLEVKGRAPKTNYSRAQFGEGWAELDGCDMRNWILKRDLKNAVIDQFENCKVLSGLLEDPYTGKTVNFVRGEQTSDDVQIDHMVALSDAWQKGAQSLDLPTRVQFANDPLNLLAVDGPINMKKGDGDGATWLPPNKDYRCRYVARQVAVKSKYRLWVTEAERDAIKRVLHACPDQRLPESSSVE